MNHIIYQGKKAIVKGFLIKTFIFCLVGLVLFLGWGWYWGLFGILERNDFDRILASFTPWQKQELADALNYYYNKNLTVKYTSGYILRCDPDEASIKRQFNWFYRSSPGAVVERMPDYHEVVRTALSTQVETKALPAASSTISMETMLEMLKTSSGYGIMTRKDAVGLGIGASSLAFSIFVSAFNPIAGAAFTAASLTQASLSDPAKAIPGIITFKKIRCRNFSYCFLISWGLSVFMFYRRSAPAKEEKVSAKKKKKAPVKKKKASPKK